MTWKETLSMNTTVTRTVALAGLLSLALWVAPPMAGAFGHGGPRGGGMGPDDPSMLFPMILRGLNLTSDQQSKIHAIMEAHRPKFQELFAQARSAQQAVMERLLAPGPATAEDLAPMMQQAIQARGQLMQEGLRAALDVRGVLTPDQLAKAADVQKQMEALHAQMQKLVGEGPDIP
jgi:Spy/CpxP family protein refolding chaperone